MPLFQRGENSYHCFRIPSIIVTGRGKVLALAEARKNNCDDHGDVDLALKRSSDGGHTWSRMRIIADDENHTMGNPCPVLDRTTDTIWLAMTRTNQRVLVMKSTDEGETWSAPVDITQSAMDRTWHWVGTGPGHGIQLKSGRLILPCWADATPKLGETQFSYVLYSDDHGTKWQRSQPLNHDASDECEVVQLSDGRLYLNARSRQDRKRRAYAYSEDEGQTWSRIRFDERLPEPSCQGSVIRFSSKSQHDRSRILLSTPADPSARKRMTVRVSYDECRSWPVAKVVYAGPAAYSDLAVSADRSILLLYETDEYSAITLALFNIEWLETGHP
jgi:sialidase-1